MLNDRGERLACCLTSAHRANAKLLPNRTQRLLGKLFGDKGYLSQPLLEQLLPHGVQHITRLTSNMKNRLISLSDKLLRRQRPLIESSTDPLKHVSLIEHPRQRSPLPFCLNRVAGLIADSPQPQKPSLPLNLHSLEAVTYPCLTLVIWSTLPLFGA